MLVLSANVKYQVLGTPNHHNILALIITEISFLFRWHNKWFTESFIQQPKDQLPGWNASIFGFKIYWFIWKVEFENERERENEWMSLPNQWLGLGQIEVKRQDFPPGIPRGSRSQALVPSFTAFSEALAESWIGRGSSWGCQRQIPSAPLTHGCGTLVRP